MGRPKGSKNKPKTGKAAKAVKTTKRKYTRRAPVAASTGGNRAGAGRKSIEVHFANLADVFSAKIDTLARELGVDPAKLIVAAPAPIAAPVEVPAAPVSEKQVAAHAALAAPAPAPKKRGRPPKVRPVDTSMPAPTFAAPVAPASPVVQPVAPVPVQYAQPVVAASPVPVMQVPQVPPQLVQVAQPVAPPQAYVQPAPVPQIPAPVQYAQPAYVPAPQQPAPVVFAPPAPVPVQPQFISVAPIMQNPPPANGQPDFEQEFKRIQEQGAVAVTPIVPQQG